MESDRMKYNMIISAGEAKGVLQDGTPFVIDADMVDVFCQYSWNVNKDGYIRRSERGKAPVMLHRWIMSENNPLIIVDHINRIRTDCRRKNLRRVTTWENSMNHSFLRSNQTGYIGVYYSKSSERYEAKVGYKGKRIFLGSVKKESEITKLAQMYNIAASFLFGPFTGSLNETPSPDEKLIQYVQTKCRKYKEERNEYFNKNAACVS